MSALLLLLLVVFVVCFCLWVFFTAEAGLSLRHPFLASFLGEGDDGLTMFWVEWILECEILCFWVITIRLV